MYIPSLHQATAPKFSGVSVGSKPDVDGKRVFSFQIVAPHTLPDSPVRPDTTSLKSDDIIGYGYLKSANPTGSAEPNLMPNEAKEAKDFATALTDFFFDAQRQKKGLNFPPAILFALAKGLMLNAMALLRQPASKTNITAITDCKTVSLQNDTPDIIEFLFETPVPGIKRAYTARR